MIQLELGKSLSDAATSLLFLPVKITSDHGRFAYESEVVWNSAPTDTVPGAALLAFDADASLRTQATTQWLAQVTAFVRSRPSQVEGVLHLA